MFVRMCECGEYATRVQSATVIFFLSSLYYFVFIPLPFPSRSPSGNEKACKKIKN